jgi:hypothetical protein
MEVAERPTFSDDEDSLTLTVGHMPIEAVLLFTGLLIVNRKRPTVKGVPWPEL